MTEIFFFVLIPRFGCFGVTYVTLCLKFKGLSETFFKNTKWSVNTFQQQKKSYTLVLMISGKSVLTDSINNVSRLLQGTIT